MRRLEELFTSDVVYDLTDFGQGPLSGVTAIQEAAWALGAANPVAHHLTHIVVTAWADGRVQVPSKGWASWRRLLGSVSYDDTVVRTAEG